MSRTSLPAGSFWRITIPVFAVFVLLNYLPVLRGKVPFPRDLVLTHAAWDGMRPEAPRSYAGIIDVAALSYPFHAVVGRAASEGSPALWNPYILSGAPLLANSQSALFYPFNAAYYVLPLPVAWTLALTIRMLLAGLFMALFVREAGGTTTGSIVSGMIFSACGFMTAWQGQAIGDSAIWLPLICYSVSRLHRSPSAGSIALAAILFAMPVLAGHPETAFHLTLMGTALALALWAFPWDAASRRFNSRFLFAFCIAGILAIGVASIQLLPTLEWLPQVNLKVDQPEPALTRHDAQGFFSRDLASGPNSAFIPIPEGASFVGMMALLLAPLAFVHRSRRTVIFLAAATVLAVAIAYSVQPMRWIVIHLPLIRAMKNARFILIASFGIAALAGLGVSVLEERKTGRTARLLVGGAFFVALFGVFEIYRATANEPSFMTGPRGALLFLVVAVAIISAQLRGWIPAPLFAPLICGVTALELITVSYGFLGFASAEEIFPRPPVFEFLAKQGDPSTFRIAKAGYPIPANSGAMYGIHMAEGYDIATERTRLFTRGLTETRDDGVFFLSEKILENPDRRLDLLNVKYLLVIAPSVDFDRFASRPDRFKLVYQDKSTAVFENRSVLPRGFVLPEGIGDVQLSESRNNGYAFRTNTTASGVFVLSQIYYPGWRATIDGRDTKVNEVESALTGIDLPAGSHEVRFAFEPRSFKIGALISIVSVAAIAAMFIPRRQRKTT